MPARPRAADSQIRATQWLLTARRVQVAWTWQALRETARRSEGVPAPELEPIHGGSLRTIRVVHGTPDAGRFPPMRWLEMRMMQPRGVALRHFDNQ